MTTYATYYLRLHDRDFRLEADGEEGQSTIFWWHDAIPECPLCGDLLLHAACDERLKRVSVVPRAFDALSVCCETCNWRDNRIAYGVPA